MKTIATLCSGFGGVDVGAKAAGLELAWGVEYDARIAEVANYNLGNHIKVANLLDCNPMDFECVDVLHASPPCPNFSVAKAGGKETALDLALASKVAEFVTVLQPEIFTLENVYAYRNSKSWRLIENALYAAGYWLHIDHVNSADYSVPQTRKRLIVRAVHGGFVPYLPQPEPRIGWYAAIEDLIPTLPDSHFAPWQIARLDPELLKIITSNKGKEEYGDNKETIAAKVLQILHQRVGSEVLQQWGIGVLEGFQQAKILRQGLYGEIIRTNCAECSDHRRQLALLFSEICSQWQLRNLWIEKCERCSSQESGLDGQLIGEFTTYLSELSHENSQPANDLLSRWMQRDSFCDGLLQQALSSFQKIWRSIVFKNKNSGTQEDTNNYASGIERQGEEQDLGCVFRQTFAQPESGAKGSFLMGKNRDKFGDGIRWQAEPTQTIGANEHGSKAFIVEGSAAGEDNKFAMPVRMGDEPVFTMRAAQNNPRAFLITDQYDKPTSCADRRPQLFCADEPSATVVAGHHRWIAAKSGRVVSMTPRCLARFQSFPDWYQLSGNKSLDSKGIGNAVPPLLMEKIYRGLRG